jgi:hypothetical protein
LDSSDGADLLGRPLASSSTTLGVLGICGNFLAGEPDGCPDFVRLVITAATRPLAQNRKAFREGKVPI